MTKTTGLPWDTQQTAGGHQTLIWDGAGKTIALVYTNPDDAAFIVRAVNSHAALVEALEASIEWMEQYENQGMDDWTRAKLTQARAALDLAKGA